MAQPRDLTYIPVLQLVSQYGVDPDVTRMMDSITWVIIPVLNVDGYAYSWTNVSVNTIQPNRYILSNLKYHNTLRNSAEKNTVLKILSTLHLGPDVAQNQVELRDRLHWSRCQP